MLLKKYIAGILLVVLFGLLYLYLQQSGYIDLLMESEKLQTLLEQSGFWGALVIIILMSVAIVMSPIPSAPIAVASGMAYGHIWGTFYVMIGAVSGAVIAFTLARLLGFDAMQKKFGDKLKFRFLNSGRNIMIIVLVSRLIPFISFDIVSYAAGLTRISYLQFIIATVIGIFPASFLLAYFGESMVGDDANSMMITILLLGTITLIPVVAGIVKKYRYTDD